MLDFGLVAEALRGARAADQQRWPRTWCGRCRSSTRSSAGAGSGSTPAPACALYDALAIASGKARGVPHHRHLTRARRAARSCPSLRKDSLVGALQYYDAQVDDARHTMFLSRTAAAYGAHVASRARVVGFLREGERVTGAEVHGPGDAAGRSTSAPGR